MTTTHDYTKRHWGHDYAITDIFNGGQIIRMMGWGRGLSKGDYMLLQDQSKEPGVNSDTRYKVLEVSYMSDPSDMWSVRAEFAPRRSQIAEVSEVAGRKE